MRKRRVMRDYIIDGVLLRIMKRGRYATVQFNGKVIFNNFKSGKSYRKWWRKFKKEMKDATWQKFPKKRLKDKEQIYMQAKHTFQNRIKGRR